DATAALQCGFAGYLTKPIRKAQLQACLETVMGSHSTDVLEASSPLVTSHYLHDLQRQRARRILVADDHHVNQQLAVLMVERLGFRADVTANGQEVLEALSRIPYDLILMDCQMPEMDGYEATKKIREAEKVKREALGGRGEGTEEIFSDALRLTPHGIPRIPIIALTANAMQGDREKCLAAGMDDYLSKPIRPEELARVFAKWLPQQILDIPTQDVGPYPLSPSPPPESTGQPAVNTQTLKELEELGGRAFLESMIEKFVEDALQCVTQIEQAMDTHNLTQLQEAAHGLKGISRNMGADSLAQLAVQFEATCKAGEATALSDWEPQLQDAFQQTRQELEGVLRNT
ncbi:MAG: response regulator, partial [Nitrospirota bacterium]|nr:response regulator [Nitrospirota bacterium]